MAEYRTSVLGWSGNIDAALEDFFAETAALGDTLIVDGYYTTSLASIDIPDSFTMRAGQDKAHGFLRSGHATNAPLFIIGDGFTAQGIKGVADGWEESNDEAIELFRGNGVTGAKFIDLFIQGRERGLFLLDSPDALVLRSHIEGCKHGVYLQGVSHRAKIIANNITGGYLAGNFQGEAVKTVRSTSGNGPTDVEIYYNRLTTLRGGVDTTGGLLRGKLGYNYIYVPEDEGFDVKAQYADQTEIDLVKAAGTALNQDIQTFGNVFDQCGITCTTNYGAMVTVSDADIEATGVNDCAFGTAARPDLFIGVSGVVMLRDYASRRITQYARTSGLLVPYKRLTAGTYNPLPENITQNVKWTAEWEATVALFVNDYTFVFLDGSTVQDTPTMTLFAAKGTDGITLSGTATKGGGAGTITTLNNTSDPATNVTNTMSIV